MRETGEYSREATENNYLLLKLFQLRKLKFRFAAHERQKINRNWKQSDPWKNDLYQTDFLLLLKKT